jgi:hypothetical protein
MLVYKQGDSQESRVGGLGFEFIDRPFVWATLGDGPRRSASISPVPIKTCRTIGAIEGVAALGRPPALMVEDRGDRHAIVGSRTRFASARVERGRDGAGVIKPRSLARHRCMDVAQRMRPRQLGEQQRYKLMLGLETMDEIVGSMGLHELLENVPGNEFQYIGRQY